MAYFWWNTFCINLKSLFIGFSLVSSRSKTYGLSLVVDVVRLDGLDFKSVGTSWLLSFFAFLILNRALGSSLPCLISVGDDDGDGGLNQRKTCLDV